MQKEGFAMRKLIAAVLMLALFACACIPSVSFTEDQDTVQLARAIYALGKGESYETKLALGSVVMNRVDSPWFADSLGEVLADQQQFPAGQRYDDASLQAAHELISGERTLDTSALYYQSTGSADSWGEENLVESCGGYNFYSEKGIL